MFTLEWISSVGWLNGTQHSKAISCPDAIYNFSSNADYSGKETVRLASDDETETYFKADFMH